VPFGDGRLVLSPTDLVGHLACPHLTTLEHAVVALIRTLGDAHEQSVVDEMRSLLDVVEIPRSDDLPAAEQLRLGPPYWRVRVPPVVHPARRPLKNSARGRHHLAGVEALAAVRT
jgi:hypothetical protein